MVAVHGGLGGYYSSMLYVGGLCRFLVYMPRYARLSRFLVWLPRFVWLPSAFIMQLIELSVSDREFLT